MSSVDEINRSLAGSRRNRKNAVDLSMEFDKGVDKIPQGTIGRPSKGGEKVRAKRYYVKNHLLVLHKRKLKRYHDKVIKLLCKHIYNEEELLKELRRKCASYMAKYPSTKEFHLIYYANIVREDKYLPFLEEAANAFLESFEEETPPIEILQPLERCITTKHSLLLLHMCTLLSAYLLIHHVSQTLKDVPEGEEKQERVRQACTEAYVISYQHLVNLYKDVPEDENEVAEPVHTAVYDMDECDGMDEVASALTMNDADNQHNDNIEENGRDDQETVSRELSTVTTEADESSSEGENETELAIKLEAEQPFSGNSNDNTDEEEDQESEQSKRNESDLQSDETIFTITSEPPSVIGHKRNGITLTSELKKKERTA